MTFGFKIIFVSLFTLVAQAAVSDFSIQVTGPKSGYRGYPLYLKLQGTVLGGTDTDLVKVTITKQPVGVQTSWVRGCCNESQIYQVAYPQMLVLKTDANTPLGSNSVVITYALPSGLTRQVTHDFTIGTVQTVNLPAVLPANKDLPTESLWREHARLGSKFCLTGTVGTESDVWYYDGARTYFNVNSILGTQEMFNCAEFQNSLYRKYVLDNNGALPGWRIFPHGLAMHYEKTADSKSLQALRLLMNSSWTTPGYLGIDPEFMRDISYAIDVHLENERLGMARRPELQQLVEYLIGHLEQCFASRQKLAQPFVVGLAAEALIAYWDATKDPRIVPVLKMTADAMWQQSWNATAGSFANYNFSAVPPTPLFDGTADLNLLIAPLYGWVYQQTADVKYRDMGDAIFTGGVQNAYLGGGKQFSQNYRWGHRYIEWRRLSTPAPTPVPLPPITGSAPTSPSNHSVTPAAGSAAGDTFTTLSFTTSQASPRTAVFVIQPDSAGASPIMTNACAAEVYSNGALLLADNAGQYTNGNLYPSQSWTGSRENSQCLIDGVNSPAVTSTGSSITFSLRLKFKSIWAGRSLRIFIRASNTSYVYTPWQQAGTFTVTGGTSTSSSTHSVTPAAGSAAGDTFTTLSFTTSQASPRTAVFVIQPDSAGASPIMTNACAAEVYSNGALLLADNAGQYTNGNLYPSQSWTGSRENSQCLIDGVNSPAVTSTGSSITFSLRLKFKSIWAGRSLRIFIRASNTSYVYTPWQQAGTFTVQ